MASLVIALACILALNAISASGELVLEHQGCFIDTPTSDLELRLTAEDLQQPNSPEVCARACVQRGYSVIGLQWGDACWCGSTFGRYGLSQIWPCDEPCPGNCERTCGGPWTNDVYSIKQTGTPTLRHEGCFLDSPTSDLTLQLATEDLGEPNSPEVCARACAQRGYSVMGLQWGDTCWCGNKFGRYGRSQLWPCDEPCPGNCEHTCGGPWTNDVYSLLDDTGSSFADQIVSRYSPNVQEPTAYMGCWNSTSELGLTERHSMPGSLTQEACVQRCAGAKYMGLEAGRICLCGDQQGEYARVMETSCDRRCEGNDEEMCGGNTFVSLFALAQ